MTSPFRGARIRVCGTPEYMAPDVLARKPSGWHGRRLVGSGLCCYELLTGLPAWYTSDRRKLFDRIRLSTSEAASHRSLSKRALSRGVAAKASRSSSLASLSLLSLLRLGHFSRAWILTPWRSGRWIRPSEPVVRGCRGGHIARTSTGGSRQSPTRRSKGRTPPFLDGDDAPAAPRPFVRPEPPPRKFIACRPVAAAAFGAMLVSYTLACSS